MTTEREAIAREAADRLRRWVNGENTNAIWGRQSKPAHIGAKRADIRAILAALAPPATEGGTLTPGQHLHALRMAFFNGGGWADAPEWTDYDEAGHEQWERLAEAVAKLSADDLAGLAVSTTEGGEVEPVAWRFRSALSGEWVYCGLEPKALSCGEGEKQPLYAASQPAGKVTREEVARIIEHAAWVAKDVNPDWTVISLTRKAMAPDLVRRSLKKADEILALFSPKEATEGQDGPVVADGEGGK